MQQNPIRTVLLASALVLSMFGAALVPMTASGAHAAGSITVSRTEAVTGNVLTVTGSGYPANETVVTQVTFRVYGKDKTIQTVVRANGNGRFTTSITVPNGTNVGDYTITSKDLQGDVATQLVHVIPLVQLKAGSVSNLVALIPGRHFIVSGSGFYAGEKVTISVSFPMQNGSTTNESTTITANSSGDFGDVLLTTPAGAKGVASQLKAIGVTSKRQALATVAVTYHAYLNPVQSTVAPGQTTTVRGGGFMPGSLVDVWLSVPRTDGTILTMHNVVTASADGSVSTSFTVPRAARAGKITFTALDRQGGFKATSFTKVVLTAHITLSPGTVYPGQTTTVNGSGYPANTRVSITGTVRLANGSSRVVSVTATTNSGGSFSVPLTVPADAANGVVLNLAVRNESTGQTAFTQLAIARVTASLRATPQTISPGSRVTVTGGGFVPGSSVDVWLNVPRADNSTETLHHVVVAAANGTISSSFVVPMDAAKGRVTFTAHDRRGGFRVNAYAAVSLAAHLGVSPGTVMAGKAVTVTGSGFTPNASITITAVVPLTTGGSKTVTLTVRTNGSGSFQTQVTMPQHAATSTLTLAAQGPQTSAHATLHLQRLVVQRVIASVVATPNMAQPGQQIVIAGFGFGAGQPVTLAIHGQTVGTATAGSSGRFSVAITVPSNLASGSYSVTATAGNGKHATAPLNINRQFSTRFYFASFYTGNGYQETLQLLNPSNISARVTINYELVGGKVVTKSVSLAAHTQMSEDVNSDLGPHVSAGAVVSADVPIVAARFVTHGYDGDMVPGVRATSTNWYFADGNTTHKYREYIAILNPGNGPVQVGVHFYPSHHAAFTMYRTIGAYARTTVKVNSYVRDAVGVEVTSNGPVVANRTIFVLHGMTSKIGVSAPERSWYFAAGPLAASARAWLGVINPANTWSYVTLRAYNADGMQVGFRRGWLKPHARAGYMINKIAGGPGVAVSIQASRPVVAEQMSYQGRMHDDSTDTFGATKPTTMWAFPAASTVYGDDVLQVFNPTAAPAPVVVQFITAQGQVKEHTYVVQSMTHRMIDVGALVPRTQLGVIVSSSVPVVVMDRMYFSAGRGSAASTGIPLA